MKSLPDIIQELSEEGCSDYEAIDIAVDLVMKKQLKDRFKRKLDQIKLTNTIQATKNLPEQESVLYKILLKLSRRERQCYTMHEMELMSMGKIANELRISKGAVQHYIMRARKKISQNLNQGA